MILIIIIIALIIFLFMNLQETFFPTPKYKLIENFVTSISGSFLFPIVSVNNVMANKFFNPTINGGTVYNIYVNFTGNGFLPSYFCVTTSDQCNIPTSGSAYTNTERKATANYIELKTFSTKDSTGYNNLINLNKFEIASIMGNTPLSNYIFNVNITDFKNSLSTFLTTGSNNALASLNTGSNNALASKVTGSNNVLGSLNTGSNNAWGSKAVGSTELWGSRAVGSKNVLGSLNTASDNAWGSKAVGSTELWGSRATGSKNVLGSLNTGSNNALASKVTGSDNALASKVTGSKAASCISGYTKVLLGKVSKCVNCTQFGGTLSGSLSDGYYVNATGNKILKKIDITNYPICTQTCPDSTTISGLSDIGTLSFNQTKSILNFCSNSGFVCATGYKKSGTTCVLDTNQTCAANYTYNSASNICIPNSCPSGYTLSGGFCQNKCEPGQNYINDTCQPTCPTNTILTKDSKGAYYCEFNIPGTENYNFVRDTANMVNIINPCTINQVPTKNADGSITCTNTVLSCPVYKGVQTTLKKDSAGNNYCWYNTCAIDEILNETTNKCQKKCDLNYTFVLGANNTYSCKPSLCPNSYSSIPDQNRANYYKCSTSCPKSNIGKLTLSDKNLCVLDTSTPICANKHIYDAVQGKCITTQNFNVLSTTATLIGPAL